MVARGEEGSPRTDGEAPETLGFSRQRGPRSSEARMCLPVAWARPEEPEHCRSRGACEQGPSTALGSRIPGLERGWGCAADGSLLCAGRTLGLEALPAPPSQQW